MENAINTTVTEAGLKQLDKLIEKLEAAEAKFDSTTNSVIDFYKTLGTPPKTSDALNKQLAESDRLVKQLQTDNKKLQDSYDALLIKTVKLTEAKKANSKAIYDNSVNQGILLRGVKEEEVLTSNLTTYMQKLAVERSRAAKTVADYNAQVAMGNALTEEQTAELAQATAQFTKYDNAIKAGKKSIGDAREYVGQYERANWGLNNSINQLTRELPALGINASTFFLAISNNIPALKDAIDEINIKNQNLAAQGKATTSVWSQLSSAFFSWNTLLSVSVTLMVVYGKELGNLAKEMFNFSSALDEANEHQKKFNETKLEGRKDAQTDIIELRKYLAVVKDRMIADDLRQVALKKLRSEYPYYFKNLTDEQILNGKTSAAVKQLTIDLEKRKEVEKKTALNVENRQKLIDLEKEQAANEILFKQAEKSKAIVDERIAKMTESRTILRSERQEQLKVEDDYERAVKKKAKTQAQIDKINKDSATNDEAIFKLKKETIALEYTETDALDDNSRALRLNTKERQDYLASEYELWKLRKTNESNRNKDIMEDEASSYDLRLMASEQYHSNQVELAQREAQEELRLLEFATSEKKRILENEYLNEKEQLNKKLQDENTTSSQRAIIRKALADADNQIAKDRIGIEQEFNNKRLIINENYIQKYLDINKDLVGKLARIWDEISYAQQNLEIGEDELDGLKKLGEALKGITFEMPLGDIKEKLGEISRMNKQTALDINEDEAQLALDRAIRARERLEQEIRINGIANGLSEAQIQNQLNNNLALINANQSINEAEINLQKARNARHQNNVDNIRTEAEVYKEINDKILESRIQLANELKGLADLAFEQQISNYDRQIEKSNEYYDNLLENAEAGSEQEQLLEEEKQQRAEELQKRKVEMQRKQAVFNKFLLVV